MFSFLKKKEDEIEKIELPPVEEDGDKEIICSPMNGEIVPVLSAQISKVKINSANS